MNRRKKNQIDSMQQRANQIAGEIFKMLDSPPREAGKYGEETLPLKLRNLISLAAALAFQKNRDIVSDCVIDCCKAGADPEEIMEILRLAVVIAEIPANEYTDMVRMAIADYHNHK